MFKLLIVDDDRETCQFMQELLHRPDRVIELAHDPADALSRVAERPYDLVISDINLNSDISGLDVLRAFRAARPRGQVLLISGFGALETAIDAVRAGAFDFISKPFNIAEVKHAVERALSLSTQSAMEPERAPVQAAPAGLIGRSPRMMAVYNQVARAARSIAPVLIVGESGTGKELVARAVHENSPRAARPMIAVNCGAIAETLLEPELFGHVRGAFTGAIADKRGLLEQAHTGTVFLDEIGETSPALQVKLLRALQEGEIRPVGGTRPVHIDVRVIAATNTDLERAVADGRFRTDLYYRLSVIVIRTPPLRDRREDIPLLAEQFLRNACSRAGRRVQLSPSALEALGRHDWPGNVRELENAIERLVVFSRGNLIDSVDLPPQVQQARVETPEALFEDLPSIDELERRYLRHVLTAVAGNRTRAAEVLGVDRRTFYRMAERFGIDLKEE